MRTGIVILFVVIAQLCLGQTGVLDIKDSNISWTGKAAFEAYELTGTLKTRKGNISIEEDSIVFLRVEVDMRSLSHEIKDLEKHLKSDDFFDVKEFGDAIFELKSPVAISTDTFVVRGTMIIKGIGKEEMMRVWLERYNGTWVYTFSMEMDRTAYGVTFNSPSVLESIQENAIADLFLLKGSLVFREGK